MIKDRENYKALEDVIDRQLKELDNTWHGIPDTDIHGIVKHKAKREAILEIRAEMKKLFPDEFDRRDLSKRLQQRIPAEG